MTISLVAAVARGGVIGRDNTIPWRIPADLARFREITMGHPVVMGRRTWDSIPARFRPLPGRRNLVVTRRPLDVPGVEAVGSVEEALARVAEAPEVAVIGGAQLWRETLPRIGRIHLTRVHANVAGDTFFPELDPAQWREVDRREAAADERNAYPMTFVTLERS